MNEGVQGPPVYDVVIEHIQRRKIIDVPERAAVTVKGAN